MNAGQLIQTLVATVVGGLIVIATNWLSTKVKRREAIQEWYEKTYVTEGIDPVVTYLLNLNLYFYNKQLGGFVRVKDIDSFPVEAMTRLQILLDHGVVITIISACHVLLKVENENTNSEASIFTNQGIRILLDFRKELLGVIATQVNTML